MNRRYGRRKDGLIRKRYSVLLLLSLCFVLGLLLGCIFASYSTAETNSGLSNYMERYLTLVQAEHVERPTLLAVFWEICRWPLAAGVLGLTLLSVVAVPLLFLIRGFLLTYAVSAFVCLLGVDGLVLSLAIFGISALTSVAALFAIGTEAFECGRTLNEIGGRVEQSERIRAQKQLIVRVLMTICWASIGVVLQYWLSPILLQGAANGLL